MTRRAERRKPTFAVESPLKLTNPDRRKYRRTPMFRTACFLLSFVILSNGTLQARDYLIRVQPVPTAKTDTTKAKGTIEFHATAGRPIFVRSTLGGDSQFLFRGTLQKIGEGAFDIDYFCQLSELQSDPVPRLTRNGKARLVLNAKAQFISKLTAATKLSSLDFKISIRALNPVFGAMDDQSSWAVRLVDAAGKPVANARGGLYGHLSGGSNWEDIITGQSNKDGVMSFTEGRESLLWLTFYAEHKGRKLYAAAHLNPDKTRSKNYKYFTVKMTKSLQRWSKPKD